MKVEIHDLKHEKWFIEAEPTLTIAQLKDINAAERSLEAASNQKMIYSGKILKDTDTLESINYAEGKGFVVCMVSKSKKPVAKVAPAASASLAEPSKADSPSSEPMSSQTAEQANTNTGQPEDPSAVASQVSGPSAFATGSLLQMVVSNIMDMGFSQRQVMRALTKAYNNPDRAVEYLMNGDIPDEDPKDTSHDSEGEQAGSTVNNGSPEANDGNEVDEAEQPTASIDRNLFEAAEQREMEEEDIESSEEIDFHELLGLDEEQLSELRAAVRQNPQDLLNLLDPLVRSNPHVAETLINNLDQFIWFLQDTGEAGEPGDGEAPADGQTRQITITTEEEAAILRLMELGFEYDTVALAFLACEKDEQITANYLLEHGHDE